MLNELNFTGIKLCADEVRKASCNVLLDVLEVIEMIECNDDRSGWILPIDDIRVALALNDMVDAQEKRERLDAVKQLEDASSILAAFLTDNTEVFEDVPAVDQARIMICEAVEKLEGQA